MAPMLSHVIPGVSDVARAVEFYDAVLGLLGHERRWIGETGAGYGTADPLGIDTFWLTKPSDDLPATVGNGTNVAFVATELIGTGLQLGFARATDREDDR